jgi:LPS export ABC transporter permease LptG
MIYLMTPLSVLIAVLVTFGLMQKANEITAMKATGISIYRMIVPVLLIAAFIPVGLFFFDQFYLPHANKRQDQLWNAIKGKPPQTYLRPDRKWIFGQQSTIYYYELFDPDRDQFGSISVFEFNPATFQFTRRVYSTRAHWAPDLHKWIFEGGWERDFDGPAIRQYRKFDVATFPELAEGPAYFKKEVKQSSEMSYEELSRYIKDLQQSGFDVVRLRVQLQKKFAFPLITFVMAVLAIPFALSAGRRGALAGVATAIGIAVTYWVASGLFEAMGNVSQLPAALAAWAPDVIFGFAGGYMILKVPT